MAGQRKIDVDRLRQLWPDKDNTIQDIADDMNVCRQTVHFAVKRLGLPHRRVGRRPAAPPVALAVVPAVAAPPTSPAPAVTPAPAAASEGKLDTIDAQILSSGNTWRGRAEIARCHDLTDAQVLQRFHRLRAVR